MRTALLSKGLRLVPSVGFHGAEAALRDQLGDVEFPRGVAIELVESAVTSSNLIAKHHLDQQCTKHVEGHVNVVFEGLRVKLAGLSPYASWWHEAVALELKPQNAPIAALRLAEFVDDICFYSERCKTSSTLRGLNSIKAPNFTLSSGPHQSPAWFVDRAQVGSIYMAVITSMIGEGGDLSRSNQLLAKLCSRT